jgi:hypothetical protein
VLRECRKQDARELEMSIMYGAHSLFIAFLRNLKSLYQHKNHREQVLVVVSVFVRKDLSLNFFLTVHSFSHFEIPILIVQLCLR